MQGITTQKIAIWLILLSSSVFSIAAYCDTNPQASLPYQLPVKELQAIVDAPCDWAWVIAIAWLLLAILTARL